MWRETEQGLYKTFQFKDFKEAFEFMTKVSKVAEDQNHHPRWSNDYNKVEIWLSTHEAGGKITDKDHKLSQSIDNLN